LLPEEERELIKREAWDGNKVAPLEVRQAEKGGRTIMSTVEVAYDSGHADMVRDPAKE
jgi:hypothetical protein